jgi:hypothetical protein
LCPLHRLRHHIGCCSFPPSASFGFPGLGPIQVELGGLTSNQVYTKISVRFGPVRNLYITGLLPKAQLTVQHQSPCPTLWISEQTLRGAWHGRAQAARGKKSAAREAARRRREVMASPRPSPPASTTRPASTISVGVSPVGHLMLFCPLLFYPLRRPVRELRSSARRRPAAAGLDLGARSRRAVVRTVSAHHQRCPLLPLSFLSSLTVGVFSICFSRALVQTSIVAAASSVQTSPLQGDVPWGQHIWRCAAPAELRPTCYSSSSCLCLADLVVGLVLSSFHMFTLDLSSNQPWNKSLLQFMGYFAGGHFCKL